MLFQKTIRLLIAECAETTLKSVEMLQLHLLKARADPKITISFFIAYLYKIMQ